MCVFLTVLSYKHHFKAFLKGKVCLWIWIRFCKGYISQNKTPRRHVYNGLCCCFCIYLFSEGHVSTSEMLPFYTIIIFLIPLYVRTIQIHISEERSKMEYKWTKIKKRSHHFSRNHFSCLLEAEGRTQIFIHLFQIMNLILNFFHSTVSNVTVKMINNLTVLLVLKWWLWNSFWETSFTDFCFY